MYKKEDLERYAIAKNLAPGHCYNNFFYLRSKLHYIFVLCPHHTKIIMESTKTYVFTIFKIPKIKPLGTPSVSFDDTIYNTYAIYIQNGHKIKKIATFNEAYHKTTKTEEGVNKANQRTKIKLFTKCRTSHPQVFLRKGVLKICSKFTGEHPCRSVISVNFIEIALRHGCSPVSLST